ncbi:Hypothetical protein PHPALM_14713, partial [Phytophthora palmivora]
MVTTNLQTKYTNTDQFTSFDNVTEPKITSRSSSRVDTEDAKSTDSADDTTMDRSEFFLHRSSFSDEMAGMTALGCGAHKGMNTQTTQQTISAGDAALIRKKTTPIMSDELEVMKKMYELLSRVEDEVAHTTMESLPVRTAEEIDEVEMEKASESDINATVETKEDAPVETLAVSAVAALAAGSSVLAGLKEDDAALEGGAETIMVEADEEVNNEEAVEEPKTDAVEEIEGELAEVAVMETVVDIAEPKSDEEEDSADEAIAIDENADDEPEQVVSEVVNGVIASVIDEDVVDENEDGHDVIEEYTAGDGDADDISVAKQELTERNEAEIDDEVEVSESTEADDSVSKVPVHGEDTVAANEESTENDEEVVVDEVADRVEVIETDRFETVEEVESEVIDVETLETQGMCAVKVAIGNEFEVSVEKDDIPEEAAENDDGIVSELEVEVVQDGQETSDVMASSEIISTEPEVDLVEIDHPSVVEIEDEEPVTDSKLSSDVASDMPAIVASLAGGVCVAAGAIAVTQMNSTPEKVEDEDVVESDDVEVATAVDSCETEAVIVVSTDVGTSIINEAPIDYVQENSVEETIAVSKSPDAESKQVVAEVVANVIALVVAEVVVDDTFAEAEPMVEDSAAAGEGVDAGSEKVRTANSVLEEPVVDAGSDLLTETETSGETLTSEGDEVVPSEKAAEDVIEIVDAKTVKEISAGVATAVETVVTGSEADHVEIDQLSVGEIADNEPVTSDVASDMPTVVASHAAGAGVVIGTITAAQMSSNPEKVNSEDADPSGGLEDEAFENEVKFLGGEPAVVEEASFESNENSVKETVDDNSDDESVVAEAVTNVTTPTIDEHVVAESEKVSQEIETKTLENDAAVEVEVDVESAVENDVSESTDSSGAVGEELVKEELARNDNIKPSEEVSELPFDDSDEIAAHVEETETAEKTLVPAVTESDVHEAGTVEYPVDEVAIEEEDEVVVVENEYFSENTADVITEEVFQEIKVEGVEIAADEIIADEPELDHFETYQSPVAEVEVGEPITGSKLSSDVTSDMPAIVASLASGACAATGAVAVAQKCFKSDNEDVDSSEEVDVESFEDAVELSEGEPLIAGQLSVESAEDAVKEIVADDEYANGESEEVVAEVVNDVIASVVAVDDTILAAEPLLEEGTAEDPIAVDECTEVGAEKTGAEIAPDEPVVVANIDTAVEEIETDESDAVTDGDVDEISTELATKQESSEVNEDDIEEVETFVSTSSKPCNFADEEQVCEKHDHITDEVDEGGSKQTVDDVFVDLHTETETSVEAEKSDVADVETAETQDTNVVKVVVDATVVDEESEVTTAKEDVSEGVAENDMEVDGIVSELEVEVGIVQDVQETSDVMASSEEIILAESEVDHVEIDHPSVVEIEDEEPVTDSKLSSDVASDMPAIVASLAGGVCVTAGAIAVTQMNSTPEKVEDEDAVAPDEVEVETFEDESPVLVADAAAFGNSSDAIVKTLPVGEVVPISAVSNDDSVRPAAKEEAEVDSTDSVGEVEVDQEKTLDETVETGQVPVATERVVEEDPPMAIEEKVKQQTEAIHVGNDVTSDVPQIVASLAIGSCAADAAIQEIDVEPREATNATAAPTEDESPAGEEIVLTDTEEVVIDEMIDATVEEVLSITSADEPRDSLSLDVDDTAEFAGVDSAVEELPVAAETVKTDANGTAEELVVVDMTDSAVEESASVVEEVVTNELVTDQTHVDEKVLGSPAVAEKEATTELAEEIAVEAPVSAVIGTEVPTEDETVAIAASEELEPAIDEVTTVDEVEAEPTVPRSVEPAIVETTENGVKDGEGGSGSDETEAVVVEPDAEEAVKELEVPKAPSSGRRFKNLLFRKKSTPKAPTAEPIQTTDAAETAACIHVDVEDESPVPEDVSVAIGQEGSAVIPQDPELPVDQEAAMETVAEHQKDASQIDNDSELTEQLKTQEGSSDTDSSEETKTVEDVAHENLKVDVEAVEPVAEAVVVDVDAVEETTATVNAELEVKTTKAAGETSEVETIDVADAVEAEAVEVEEAVPAVNATVKDELVEDISGSTVEESTETEAVDPGDADTIKAVIDSTVEETTTTSENAVTEQEPAVESGVDESASTEEAAGVDLPEIIASERSEESDAVIVAEVEANESTAEETGKDVAVESESVVEEVAEEVRAEIDPVAEEAVEEVTAEPEAEYEKAGEVTTPKIEEVDQAEAGVVEVTEGEEIDELSNEDITEAEAEIAVETEVTLAEGNTAAEVVEEAGDKSEEEAEVAPELTELAPKVEESNDATETKVAVEPVKEPTQELDQVVEEETEDPAVAAVEAVDTTPATVEITEDELKPIEPPASADPAPVEDTVDITEEEHASVESPVATEAVPVETAEVTQDELETVEVTQDEIETVEVTQDELEATESTPAVVPVEKTEVDSIAEEDTKPVEPAPASEGAPVAVDETAPAAVDVHEEELKSVVTQDELETVEVTQNELETVEVTQDELEIAEVTHDEPETAEVTQDELVATESTPAVVPVEKTEVDSIAEEVTKPVEPTPASHSESDGAPVAIDETVPVTVDIPEEELVTVDSTPVSEVKTIAEVAEEELKPVETSVEVIPVDAAEAAAEVVNEEVKPVDPPASPCTGPVKVIPEAVDVIENETKPIKPTPAVTPAEIVQAKEKPNSSKTDSTRAIESEEKKSSEPEQKFEVDTKPISAVSMLIGRFEQFAKRNAEEAAHSRTSSRVSSRVSSPIPSPPSTLPRGNVFETAAQSIEAIEKANGPVEEPHVESIKEEAETDVIEEEKSPKVEEMVDESSASAATTEVAETPVEVEKKVVIAEAEEIAQEEVATTSEIDESAEVSAVDEDEVRNSPEPEEKANGPVEEPHVESIKEEAETDVIEEEKSPKVEEMVDESSASAATTEVAETPVEVEKKVVIAEAEEIAQEEVATTSEIDESAEVSAVDEDEVRNSPEPEVEAEPASEETATVNDAHVADDEVTEVEQTTTEEAVEEPLAAEVEVSETTIDPETEAIKQENTTEEVITE